MPRPSYQDGSQDYLRNLSVISYETHHQSHNRFSLSLTHKQSNKFDLNDIKQHATISISDIMHGGRGSHTNHVQHVIM